MATASIVFVAINPLPGARTCTPVEPSEASTLGANYQICNMCHPLLLSIKIYFQASLHSSRVRLHVGRQLPQIYNMWVAEAPHLNIHRFSYSVSPQICEHDSLRGRETPFAISPITDLRLNSFPQKSNYRRRASLAETDVICIMAQSAGYKTHNIHLQVYIFSSDACLLKRSFSNKNII